MVMDGPPAELRASDERFRQFGEHAPDAMWMVDADTGRLEYLSPAFERIWGARREDVMADLSRWREFLHPDDRAAVDGALPRLIAGEAVTAEYRIRRPDGGTRWIRDVGFAIRDEGGRIVRVAGIAHDFTDERAVAEALRESECQQRLLSTELQRRVRNNLAVIRSVARRTADVSETLEDFTAHLDGRLGALSRAQVAASRDPTRGIDLRALLDDELLAAAAGQGHQFRIAGPEVRLRPKAAETMGLLFHELATNSIKYGALAGGGTVAVTWRVEGLILTLDWRETLREPVVPATAPHRGFGTDLLEQTVPYELDGDVESVLHPSGQNHTVRLPLNGSAL